MLVHHYVETRTDKAASGSSGERRKPSADAITMPDDVADGAEDAEIAEIAASAEQQSDEPPQIDGTRKDGGEDTANAGDDADAEDGGGGSRSPSRASHRTEVSHMSEEHGEEEGEELTEEERAERKAKKKAHKKAVKMCKRIAQFICKLAAHRAT